MRSHAGLVIRYGEARQGFAERPAVAELYDNFDNIWPSCSGIVREQNSKSSSSAVSAARAGACRSALGGPQGAPRGGGPISESPVAVQRPTNQCTCLSSNATHTTIFAVGGIGGSRSPGNRALSMPLRTIGRIELSTTRPISKACRRVMRVIDRDLNISARSSERVISASSSSLYHDHEARSGPCSIVRGGRF